LEGLEQSLKNFAGDMDKIEMMYNRFVMIFEKKEFHLHYNFEDFIGALYFLFNYEADRNCQNCGREDCARRLLQL
jgi:hypothetical protein